VIPSGTPAELLSAIKAFRLLLWRKEEDDGCQRRERLRSIIAGCLQITEIGTKQIQYKINSRPVCKHFFRDASGFRRQLFDSVVSEVLSDEVAQEMRIQYPRQRSQDVVGFLDAYFLGPGRAGKDY
jgi:hypothetical protein